MLKNENTNAGNPVILSQAEVDRLLSGSGPQPVKKQLTPETEAKIQILRERAKAVEKKMKEHFAAKVSGVKSKVKAVKKPAASKVEPKKAPAKTSAAKSSVKKAAPKKSTAPKKAAPKKSSSKKTPEKLSVYFEGKLYGKAIITKKKDKKIIELVSIKK
ncbi:hypothetical protein [Treponema sp.]|uniref:hypothetical protein n=1 Tax=Treponema sp. TaxID=166 RepID=UPI00298E7983|nr:hypothetical protein [Treponema sp.]MCR5612423.1 hypothetical protein [Treponema sp.]